MKKTLRRWSAVLVTVLVLVGTGCMPEPVATPTAPVVTLAANLDVAAVEALHADGAVTIVDVREEWEYDAGHVPGALHIPLGELAQRLDEVPSEEPVVLVCRSGNRSSQAQRFLQQEGFDNAHNMLGGMSAWEQAGYEVEQ